MIATVLAVLAWFLAAVSGYGTARHDAPGFCFALGTSFVLMVLSVMLLRGF